MRKDAKPSAQLLPNFDYKIAQFSDFYNLETNNFDESQQGLAQHLIGYQRRDYLINLGFEEQTQYKLYQGFIKDKGTTKVVDRLVAYSFYLHYSSRNYSFYSVPIFLYKVSFPRIAYTCN